MPTYEYECKDCNYRFDVFQSMNAEKLKVCPECDGHLQRLISGGSGVLFKGTGWYQTDFKNKNQETPPSKDNKSEKKESSQTKPPTTPVSKDKSE